MHEAYVTFLMFVAAILATQVIYTWCAQDRRHKRAKLNDKLATLIAMFKERGICLTDGHIWHTEECEVVREADHLYSPRTVYALSWKCHRCGKRRHGRELLI